MMFRVGSRVWLKKALIVAALIAAATAGKQARADLKDAGPADLKQHLGNLEAVVQACRSERNTKACDQSLVGPDDRLQWMAGTAKESREIRYDWLRDLLDRAGKKDAAQKESAAPQSNTILPQVSVIQQKRATLDELLGTAIDRLKDEQGRIDALTGSLAANDFAGQRKKLAEILSRRAYKEVAENTAKNRFWEWVDNLINRLVSKLAGFGGKAPWLPDLLLGLLIGGVLIGLVWSLIQIERRSRIRLIPETTSMGAPSAREWQLWLKDAQDAAAAGLWREAIHFLYWAAISRLESKRLWPADRARTPREYLLLLPSADPRRDNLTTLTRSFERTWYGGREAALTDYEAARTLAAGLGVE